MPRQRQKTRRLDDIVLTLDQRNALEVIRHRLYSQFQVHAVVLFGSVARGEADADSDVDLLIITPQPMTSSQRHEITDMVCEVNLAFGTNFSTLVVDRYSWEEGRISVLPLKTAILKEGIPL